ncbi:MAG: aldehyde dehydrogenase family protein, partial [Mycobacteriales bacterium]
MTDEKAVLAAAPTGTYIDGEFRAAAGGATFPVDDPSTGEVLNRVADARAPDADAALAAATAAAAGWAGTAARERGEILRRAYELLAARADDLGLLITLEMGKPLAESKGEVTYAAEFFRWFAEEAVRIRGSFGPSPAGDLRILTMKQPVGPCLLVTPWNFPLAMGTRKIGAALAAGCTVVLKPAEQTPLSALVLAQVLGDAGLPKGVVNVVPTSDPAAVVTPLMADSRLRQVSFTGSTEIGTLLMRQASDNLLRISMELGGNAPFLVFGDADLDAAIDGAALAKLRNVGESCVAANRFLVHESVAAEFAHRLAERFATLTVGRGTADGVDIGPLIDAAGRDKVGSLVEDAVAVGAKALVGGEPVDGPGYF